MWKTFLAELKHIFKHKFRPWEWLIICIVPFLYGFMYMNAYWQPFNKSDQLRVGIVNLDKGATDYTSKSKAYLDDLVANGKAGINAGDRKYKITIDDVSGVYADNNWTVESAEKEVKDNNYDAMIIIDKGFETKVDTISRNLEISIAAIISGKATLNQVLSAINVELEKLQKTPLVKFYNSAKNSYLASEMTNFGGGLTQFNISSLLPTSQEIATKTGLDINSVRKIRIAIDDLLHDNNIIDASKSIGKPINTYGFGLAPYFICIALWAGALTMTFLIKNERHYKGANTFKHYFGKSLMWILTGWIQAIILCTAVTIQGVHINGHVIENWQLYLLAMFISTIFTMTVQGVAYMCRYGDIGEFLAVFLLVIQLISSSGTFPVEIQSAIFGWLNPIIPFTYGINAIREIMYMPDMVTLFRNLLILMVFPAVVVPLSLLINYKFDIRTFRKSEFGNRYQSFEIELDDF